MNFWDIGGALMLAVGVVLSVVLVGGVLLLLLLRKMSGSPLGVSPAQVEQMLSQAPTLEYNFIAAPPPAIFPDLVQGLSTLGYEQWKVFFINQSKVLTAYTAHHPNGTIAVVYQHGFMGTWFEIYAQTPDKTYMWSSTPLFDESTVRDDVVITHHRLLTIHTPLDDIAALTIEPIDADSIVEYLTKEHIKNEVHRLSVPLQPTKVAALLAQTGQTDPQAVQTVQHNAQAARLSHLEDMAWKSVGGFDATGETFVVHPYSAVSEDIHVMVEHLKKERMWDKTWDATATHVPPNFVFDISTAVEKSLDYTIVKTTYAPFPVIVVGRVV